MIVQVRKCTSEEVEGEKGSGRIGIRGRARVWGVIHRGNFLGMAGVVPSLPPSLVEEALSTATAERVWFTLELTRVLLSA
jgi:hypothetical protein